MDNSSTQVVLPNEQPDVQLAQVTDTGTPQGQGDGKEQNSAPPADATNAPPNGENTDPVNAGVTTPIAGDDQGAGGAPHGAVIGGGGLGSAPITGVPTGATGHGLQTSEALGSLSGSIHSASDGGTIFDGNTGPAGVVGGSTGVIGGGGLGASPLSSASLGNVGGGTGLGGNLGGISQGVGTFNGPGNGVGGGGIGGFVGGGALGSSPVSGGNLSALPVSNIASGALGGNVGGFSASSGVFEGAGSGTGGAGPGSTSGLTDSPLNSAPPSPSGLPTNGPGQGSGPENDFVNNQYALTPSVPEGGGTSTFPASSPISNYSFTPTTPSTPTSTPTTPTTPPPPPVIVNNNNTSNNSGSEHHWTLVLDAGAPVYAGKEDDITQPAAHHTFQLSADNFAGDGASVVVNAPGNISGDHYQVSNGDGGDTVHLSLNAAGDITANHVTLTAGAGQDIIGVHMTAAGSMASNDVKIVGGGHGQSLALDMEADGGVFHNSVHLTLADAGNATVILDPHAGHAASISGNSVALLLGGGDDTIAVSLDAHPSAAMGKVDHNHLSINGSGAGNTVHVKLSASGSSGAEVIDNSVSLTMGHDTTVAVTLDAKASASTASIQGNHVDLSAGENASIVVELKATDANGVHISNNTIAATLGDHAQATIGMLQIGPGTMSSNSVQVSLGNDDSIGVVFIAAGAGHSDAIKSERVSIDGSSGPSHQESIGVGMLAGGSNAQLGSQSSANSIHIAPGDAAANVTVDFTARASHAAAKISGNIAQFDGGSGADHFSASVLAHGPHSASVSYNSIAADMHSGGNLGATIQLKASASAASANVANIRSNSIAVTGDVADAHSLHLSLNAHAMHGGAHVSGNHLAVSSYSGNSQHITLALKAQGVSIADVDSNHLSLQLSGTNDVVGLVMSATARREAAIDGNSVSLAISGDAAPSVRLFASAATASINNNSIAVSQSGAGALPVHVTLHAKAINSGNRALVSGNDVSLEGFNGNAEHIALQLKANGGTSNSLRDNHLSLQATGSHDTIAVNLSATGSNSNSANIASNRIDATLGDHAAATVLLNDRGVGNISRNTVSLGLGNDDTVSIALKAIAASGSGSEAVAGNHIIADGSSLHGHHEAITVKLSATGANAKIGGWSNGNAVSVDAGDANMSLAVTLKAHATSGNAQIQKNVVSFQGGSGVDHFSARLTAVGVNAASIASNTILAHLAGGSDATPTILMHANGKSEIIQENSVLVTGSSAQHAIHFALQATGQGSSGNRAVVSGNQLAFTGFSGDGENIALTLRAHGGQSSNVVDGNRINVSATGAHDIMNVSLTADGPIGKVTGNSIMATLGDDAQVSVGFNALPSTSSASARRNHVDLSLGNGTDSVAISLIAEGPSGRGASADQNMFSVHAGTGIAHIDEKIMARVAGSSSGNAYASRNTLNIVAGGGGAQGDIITAAITANSNRSGDISRNHISINIGGTAAATDHIDASLSAYGGSTANVYNNTVAITAGNGVDNIQVALKATADQHAKLRLDTVRVFTGQLSHDQNRASSSANNSVAVTMSAKGHRAATLSGNSGYVYGGFGNDHIAVTMNASATKHAVMDGNTVAAGGWGGADNIAISEKAFLQGSLSSSHGQVHMGLNNVHLSDHRAGQQGHPSHAAHSSSAIATVLMSANALGSSSANNGVVMSNNRISASASSGSNHFNLDMIAKGHGWNGTTGSSSAHMARMTSNVMLFNAGRGGGDEHVSMVMELSGAYGVKFSPLASSAARHYENRILTASGNDMNFENNQMVFENGRGGDNSILASMHFHDLPTSGQAGYGAEYMFANNMSIFAGSGANVVTAAMKATTSTHRASAVIVADNSIAIDSGRNGIINIDLVAHGGMKAEMGYSQDMQKGLAVKSYGTLAVNAHTTTDHFHNAITTTNNASGAHTHTVQVADHWNVIRDGLFMATAAHGHIICIPVSHPSAAANPESYFVGSNTAHTKAYYGGSLATVATDRDRVHIGGFAYQAAGTKNYTFDAAASSGQGAFRAAYGHGHFSNTDAALHIKAIHVSGSGYYQSTPYLIPPNSTPDKHRYLGGTISSHNNYAYSSAGGQNLTDQVWIDRGNHVAFNGGIGDTIHVSLVAQADSGTASVMANHITGTADANNHVVVDLQATGAQKAYIGHASGISAVTPSLAAVTANHISILGRSNDVIDVHLKAVAGSFASVGAAVIAISDYGHSSNQASVHLTASVSGASGNANLNFNRINLLMHNSAADEHVDVNLHAHVHGPGTNGTAMIAGNEIGVFIDRGHGIAQISLLADGPTANVSNNRIQFGAHEANDHIVTAPVGTDSVVIALEAHASGHNTGGQLNSYLSYVDHNEITVALGRAGGVHAGNDLSVLLAATSGHFGGDVVGNRIQITGGSRTTDHINVDLKGRTITGNSISIRNGGLNTNNVAIHADSVALTLSLSDKGRLGGVTSGHHNSFAIDGGLAADTIAINLNLGQDAAQVAPPDSVNKNIFSIDGLGGGDHISLDLEGSMGNIQKIIGAGASFKVNYHSGDSMAVKISNGAFGTKEAAVAAHVASQNKIGLATHTNAYLQYTHSSGGYNLKYNSAGTGGAGGPGANAKVLAHFTQDVHLAHVSATAHAIVAHA